MVSAIQEYRGEVFAVHCDISNGRSVVAAHEQVRERFGALDILVNNAGGSPPLSVGDVRKWAVEGSPSPPRVWSPFGSMGPFHLRSTLNSCLGLSIPHDMDRNPHHATASHRLRSFARLPRSLRPSFRQDAAHSQYP
ncbi:SDR family NAD(P)-dependent oxidoreductase [Acetobacter senegalensis]|uniref:SDR family NAD(P)-dependent oxidoreductase n=1 Tax=Acetobacter senegalensis TaxID=446692 RepID=UPI0009EE5818